MHSQTTAPATSLGWPVRPSGICSRMPVERGRVLPQVLTVELGLDPTGMDDVRPDPERSELPRHAEGEHLQSRLGRRVVDLAGVRLTGSGRPDHDDRAVPVLWPSPRRPAWPQWNSPHMLTCWTAAQVSWVSSRKPDDRVDPGVGDEDVDPAEPATTSSIIVRDASASPTSAAQCDRRRRAGARCTRRPCPRQRSATRSLATTSHPCSANADGDRPSDAAGGAGDDDDLVAEFGVRRRRHQKWPPQAS